MPEETMPQPEDQDKMVAEAEQAAQNAAAPVAETAMEMENLYNENVDPATVGQPGAAPEAEMGSNPDVAVVPDEVPADLDPAAGLGEHGANVVEGNMADRAEESATPGGRSPEAMPEELEEDRKLGETADAFRAEHSNQDQQ